MSETRDALLSHLAGTRWPYQPLFDALDLPLTADILDIGAGAGHGLELLAKCGQRGRVIGVDFQPNANVLAASAEALPFADECFDVAFLVRVLAHLSDPAAALAEAQRVLRQGGLLVLAAQGSGHLAVTWQILGRLPSDPATGPEAALHRALHASDLSAERLDLHCPLTLQAADAEALAQSYGLTPDIDPAPFPVHDSLHLVAYLAYT